MNNITVQDLINHGYSESDANKIIKNIDNYPSLKEKIIKSKTSTKSSDSNSENKSLKGNKDIGEGISKALESKDLQQNLPFESNSDNSTSDTTLDKINNFLSNNDISENSNVSKTKSQKNKSSKTKESLKKLLDILPSGTQETASEYTFNNNKNNNIDDNDSSNNNVNNNTNANNNIDSIQNMSNADYQSSNLNADSISKSFYDSGKSYSDLIEWFKNHGGITKNAVTAINKYYNLGIPENNNNGTNNKNNNTNQQINQTNPMQNTSSITKTGNDLANQSKQTAQAGTLPIGDLSDAEKVSSEFNKVVSNVDPQYIKSLPKFAIQAYLRGDFGNKKSSQAKETLGYFLVNTLGTALSNMSASIKEGNGGEKDRQGLYAQMQSGNLQKGLERYNKLMSDNIDEEVKLISNDAEQQQEDRNELNKLYRDSVFSYYASLMGTEATAYTFNVYKQIGSQIQGLTTQQQLTLIQGMMMMKGGNLSAGIAGLVTVFGGDFVENIMDQLKIGNPDTNKALINQIINKDKQRANKQ